MKMFIETFVLIMLISSFISILILTLTKSTQLKLIEKEISKFANKTALEIELNSKMFFLSGLVSTSVYVGLLGTTIGIIYVMFSLDGGDTSTMISQLAYPLFSTAIAILIAIIGKFCLNYILYASHDLLNKWDIQHGYDSKSK